MRLGGVTVTVQANGGSGVGKGYIPELAGMPSAVMAPPRLAPSAMVPRPQKNVFSSSTLSLAPPIGLEGQPQVNESSEAVKRDAEEYESRSGSDNMEGGSGDEDPDHPPRKKRYHRHTPKQIQEMEMLFKECPHPDDKQRQELSRDLGLEPRQVKFWFQNRRTQMKAQQERAENSMLRNDNEKLRSETMAMREALKNAVCPNCGSPSAMDGSVDQHSLRLENARLKDEVDRISALVTKYLGRYPAGLPNSTLDLQVGGSGGGYGPQGGGGSELIAHGPIPDIASRQGFNASDFDKNMFIDLASSAMDELFALAQGGGNLWIPGHEGSGIKEALNYEEYTQTFTRGIGPRPFHMRTEATRESGLVMMNILSLLEVFTDPVKWAEMFQGVVSRARSVDVLHSGTMFNRHNSLQLMYAELQILSPMVPTREIYVLRFCKQHAEGVWAIVDVSVDALRDNPDPSYSVVRRRPSGCLIEEMQNGFSKVTVVEHMEVDDRSVKRMFKSFVNSGQAFGALRWISTLQRQAERHASMCARNLAQRELGGVPTTEGRQSLLKLAQRMSSNFCIGVSASQLHNWTTISAGNGSGEHDVRVMTRKSLDNPGEPHGIVLSAATSIWLPVGRERVFEFLRDETVRHEWDILSNGGMVTEMAHIAKGSDPGNSVSLLSVNAIQQGQSNMLILQESCTDSAGSMVIYAPVDKPAMQLVLHGGDPAYVALLPSGFAILPDGSGAILGNDSPRRQPGSLLTVAFQILVSSIPSASLSVESISTVNNLVTCTVQRIKAALHCDPESIGQ